ncbi:unnamed protein product [Rotaria sp. Silwood2]|nr:unnamed protein product [Rotaria sp. Silwood2]CAF4179860.1 unnamed protein product [Rotaria sp. Silwood2]
MYRNPSITSVEDLSNEIYYEIFEYLDGVEIVKAFSKLNSRFQQLLRPSSLLIKTDFYLFHYEEMINKDYDLGIFSTKLCSNLKILSIRCSQNIIFLDSNRWTQLISLYYPQLEKFYLTYNDRIDNDNQYEMYSGQIDQFSSSFWIERKWIFYIRIHNTDIKYMICPYKKMWFDYIQDNNNEYSKSTTLIITNTNSDLYDNMLLKRLDRVLTITKIYHLNITEKESSINMLVLLIKSLPDLITFKLRSLSSDDTVEFTIMELVEFFSFTGKGKVKKVYLEVINGERDFNIVRLFCPNMRYLTVKHIYNMNIQSFLRTILKKITANSKIRVRSLCFHIPLADDQVVQNLQTYIRCEQLLLQFTIKRILDDYINLQWT